MSKQSSLFKTKVAGLDLSSFLLNASGTFNPALFNELFPLKEMLGAIVTKTVTPEAFWGNPQPRVVELPGVGMLNSIGLQNPGLAYFLEKDSQSLAGYGLPVILSISGDTVEEFSQMAAQATAHPHTQSTVCALELNLSCPNVAQGGIQFGVSASMVKEAVSAVVSVYPGPVFAKLTPNVTDIVAIGAAAIEGGAQGLTAINTLLGASIDVKHRRPALNRVSGGYSGPGIKPVAVHAIWQLHKHFPETPIMGVGGVMNAHDVLEFLMAGASLVQVGTSCYRHPGVFGDIIRDLTAYAEAEGVQNFQELVGCAQGQAAIA